MPVPQGATIAAFAAALAALAGTVQAYVSWTGRNDVLRATLLASAVQKCGDLSHASQIYLDNFFLKAKYIEKGATPPPEQVDDWKAWKLLEEKMIPTQFILAVLEPKLRPELLDWSKMINQTFETYYGKTQAQRTAEDAKKVSDDALKLVVCMTTRCEEIIAQRTK